MARASNRDRLLDSAEQLFSVKGYQATSLDDIARAVGVGASAIYKHFAGKLDLYAQVLDRLAQPFLALFDHFEPHRDVAGFAQEAFRYHVAHPNLARFALHASLSGGEHRQLLIDRWYRPFYEKIVTRLRSDGLPLLAGTALEVQMELRLAPYFMAFNNIMLGYVNLAALNAEVLGVDPFSGPAVENEMALLDLLTQAVLQREAAG